MSVTQDIADDYRALRDAAGMRGHDFARSIDSRLLPKGKLPLSRSNRCLKALIARYGWQAVRAMAVEVAAIVTDHA